MTSSSFSVSAIGQARGRLVEDHEARIEAQRLGDLDHLLLGERQARHRRRRREGRAQPVEIGLHGGAQLFGVDELEEAALSRLAADVDVGADVEIVEEIELLMDEGDARAHRAANGQRRIGRAIDLDGAAVGRDDAAEDLHQGRFAGAVLADEADDLAGANLQAEIGERHHAGIGLADAGQPQERLTGRGHGNGRGGWRHGLGYNQVPRPVARTGRGMMWSTRGRRALP